MTVLVVLLCPLLMLMSAAEAWAARAIVRDERGDARKPWDITKVIVVNGQRKLKLRVFYRGRLRPDLHPGLFTDVGLDLGSPSDFVEDTDFDVSLCSAATILELPTASAWHVPDRIIECIARACADALALGASA
jgi:hypothetical protein